MKTAPRHPIDYRDYLDQDDAAYFRGLCAREEFLEDVARAVRTACGSFRRHSPAKVRDDWQVMQGKAESLLDDLRNRIYPPGYFSKLAEDLEAFVATAAETVATLAARPRRPTRQKNPIHRDVVRIVAEAFTAAGVPMSKSKGSTFEQAVLRVFEAAKAASTKNADLHRFLCDQGLAPVFPGEEYIHDLVCDSLAAD